MSEQDQQNNHDAVLGKAVRLKQNLAHAEYALSQIREQMVQVADLLGQGRRDINTPWLNSQIIAAIWADIDLAQAEYEDAYKAASALGVVVPY